MAEEKKRWRHGASPALAGTVWFMGWLFTIGYVNLIWWKILLAKVIWPYFLGRAVGG